MERQLSHFQSLAFGIGLLAIPNGINAQLNNPGGLGWWRTDVAGVNAVNGLAVGNATGPYSSAFEIHGGLMPTATGEVFRTDALNGSATHWRLLRGGTEYGHLFNLNTDVHFGLDASAGDMRFHTNGLERGRFSRTLTGQTINSYGGLDLSGFFGVGTFSNFNIQRPFSMIHIDDGGAQEDGYRSWMRAGTTITTGSDLCYFGMKFGPNNDQHAATIAWSDNDEGMDGPDLMQFIFARDNTGSSTAASLDGLQAAEFYPPTDNDVNFGVGDFFTDGSHPTERVHLLDGRLRIEQLPDDLPAVDSFYVMVVDRTVTTATNLERGVVKWVDPANFGSDCDWTRDATTNFDVCTAYPGNSCPPDQHRRVGIGVQHPKAKLEVFIDRPSEFGNDATLSTLVSDEESGRAVQGYAHSATTTLNPGSFRGVQGAALNGTYSYGVFGDAQMSCGVATSQYIAGVWGNARACNNTNLSIGVYGAAGGAIAAQNWAAYFNGNGFINAPFWVYSDSDLKENVQDLNGEDALAKIMALSPKSYEFNAGQFTSLNLPTGEQRGFLSQEVAEVIPDLVKDVHHPAVVDSNGVELEPAANFKAMNYEGLIPLLVSALQTQNQRMAAIEEQLAACCAASDGTRALAGGSVSGAALENDLRIVPNPVADRTELRYTVASEGRARLEITDASSRVVLAQEEGQRNPGSFVYEWDTTRLAPGTYICTLFVNDEFVVKKSVKLGTR